MGTVDLLTQPRRVTSTQLFSDPKSVAASGLFSLQIH